MTKKLKNSGFTLTEIIVVIAISSIFFTIVALVLQSSFNIFSDSQKEYNEYNEETLINTVFETFINEINVGGKTVQLTNNEDSSITISSELETSKLLSIVISSTNFIYQNNSNVIRNISLENIIINVTSEIVTKNLKITIMRSGVQTSERIFYVIGGITNG